MPCPCPVTIVDGERGGGVDSLDACGYADLLKVASQGLSGISSDGGSMSLDRLAV